MTSLKRSPKANPELDALTALLKSYFKNMDADDRFTRHDAHLDARIRDENKLRAIVGAPMIARKSK